MGRLLPRKSYLAESDDSRLLGNILNLLGSNVECNALNVLAQQPRVLAGFWSAIKPALQRSFVRSTANEIRREADIAVTFRIRLPNHLSWLASHDFSREDSRQIRYVVEAFHSLEPVFAVVTFAAIKWLRSGSIGPWIVATDAHDDTQPWFEGKIDFVPVGPDIPSRELSDDVDRQGHPLMRALAMWPDYLYKALGDLDAAGGEDEVRESSQVLRRTLELMMGSEPAVCAVYRHQSGTLASLDRCLDESLTAIVMVSALRRTYLKSETAARNERIKATVP